MRVTTSDGSFGFVIERTATPRFFVFQLVMGHRMLGDREPCILGSAMWGLRNLPCIDIDITIPAADLLACIRANDSWFDTTLRPLAESLDSIEVRAFTTNGVVTVLARPTVSGQRSTVLLESMPVDDYDEVVSALAAFWNDPGSARSDAHTLE